MLGGIIAGRGRRKLWPFRRAFLERQREWAAVALVNEAQLMSIIILGKGVLCLHPRSQIRLSSWLSKRIKPHAMEYSEPDILHMNSR
jgi:hypothetical protein